MVEIAPMAMLSVLQTIQANNLAAGESLPRGFHALPDQFRAAIDEAGVDLEQVGAGG